MDARDPKSVLHRYLTVAREAVLWKLEGLGEYHVRRPLTPTGTNLLGLVKHLALMEAGYFGDTFGRPFPELENWFETHPEPDADLWARADESREGIVGTYRRACDHADATITDLALDDLGHVPHWPADRTEVPLHLVLVHMTAETHRHAGHADIVRELVDGAAGMRPDNLNLSGLDAAQREGHRARLERVAEGFAM